MNLQTHIASDLWDAIASSYESGNYSHAVLEAIHRVTTVLRERSGIDGDGVALVGQALGGDAPKLRVTPLNSESERNVQKGVEHLLRGIYLAVRNPRSHEEFKDTQDNADSIIHFLDYVLKILNTSKESFTLEGFIRNITDPEFVESKRYAELLVSEVPLNRRGDALVALLSARRSVDVRKLRYLIPALRGLLNDSQLAQFMSAISDEFRTATEEAAIRTSFQMLTPELWGRIGEAARLRIENKLVRDLKSGEVATDGTVTGALATWSSSFIRNFSLRSEAANILLIKLEDSHGDDRHYVAKFFFYRLPEILTEEGTVIRAIRAITTAIRDGDLNLREALIANVRHFPSSWQLRLVESLGDLTDPSNPAVVLDDGTPLLAAPTAESMEITDDDIPF